MNNLNKYYEKDKITIIILNEWSNRKKITTPKPYIPILFIYRYIDVHRSFNFHTIKKMLSSLDTNI